MVRSHFISVFTMRSSVFFSTFQVFMFFLPRVNAFCTIGFVYIHNYNISVIGYRCGHRQRYCFIPFFLFSVPPSHPLSFPNNFDITSTRSSSDRGRNTRNPAIVDGIQWYNTSLFTVRRRGVRFQTQ